MKITKAMTIIALCILMSGCLVTEDSFNKANNQIAALQAEIAELKKSLGDFQYQAIDPALKIELSDVSFEAPENKYSSTIASFKANLIQTNESFIPKNYELHLEFKVINENNSELGSVFVTTEIKNGIAAIAENESVVGLKTANVSNLKIELKNYDWYPLQNFTN